MNNNKITVNNIQISVVQTNATDYICISDIAKAKEGNSSSKDIIKNWIRNRKTLEFIGTWEILYNANFNRVEFDSIKANAGLHTFTLNPSEWCEKTNAIGIYSKRGKYGGTYAHKDIAFEFASAISPVFKLYLIKEFQRLKEKENKGIEWNTKRILTKNNYLIHTNGIKNYIYNEIVEIEIEESKYKDYLKSINYKGIIGKIKDVEICFLHYDNIVEINEKWKRRLQRINWNRIIYKFNDQNLCTNTELEAFERFNAKNKICFTAKKHENINSIQLEQYSNQKYVISDTKEKDYKKYLDIVEYINKI